MAEAAIRAALEQGGAIRTAIVEEIAKTFQPGEPGLRAIEKAAGEVVRDKAIEAVTAVLKDPTSGLSTLIKDEYNRRADTEFPYRAKLRALSMDEWVSAWRDLVVDQDQVSWTLQAVEQNSSPATILALQAAHPENADLQQLRRASTARYAAKLSWKQLCLPSHGGSWDKLENFLMEKADSPLDNVKALARSLLVLLNLLDRRCTVVQSAKKTGPEKAAAQREHLLEFIHLAIKQCKRRTTKASASIPLGHELLLRDFAQDLILAEAALAAKGLGKRLAASDVSGAPSAKAPRYGEGSAGASPQVSARSSGSANQGFTAKKEPGDKPDREALLDTLLRELEHVVRTGSTKKIQEHVCKNCLFSGKGIVKRTLKHCKEQGNDCMLPCSKCTKAGRTSHLLHWMSECKN
ncbi:unnamed protein product [Prorocentrum cordatum]|uniref:Uncharacterized protein n=1 Tax=Prorocentrum cordatum TaxID=2364126 RepID=A0ABN9PXV1_9DINO|nr:unnamed protein product [Polarella glacialis]